MLNEHLRCTTPHDLGNLHAATDKMIRTQGILWHDEMYRQIHMLEGVLLS
jgi:hypothetical protein